MDDMNSATQALVPADSPFDGELYRDGLNTRIGWEVRDDYDTLVWRAAYICDDQGMREWIDPAFAQAVLPPALVAKVKAAKQAALMKLSREATADLPLEEETAESEGILSVEQGVVEAWDALGLVLTDKGSPIPNMDNVVRVLEGLPSVQGRIWFDEFTRSIMTGFSSTEEREWTDDDARQLWLELQRRLSLVRIGKDAVHEAVATYAYMNRRHPVKEWLSKTAWDLTPRLDTFFTTYMGAEDTAFNRSVSANFFLSMLARVFVPGCKVDNMVVLEGVQGARKSSALRALCGKWFTECNEPLSNGSNKDFYAVLQGKMLVEIAELDSFSRADILRIKAIITTATDRYRPAYGRIAQNFPRTSVFVGTTNEKEYLADSTGGRRFWPVRTARIDLDAIAADRDQLFAEALARYRLKPNWWDVPDEAKSIQEDRRKQDPWEPILETWLSLPRMVAEVSSLEMARDALEISPERMDQRAYNRIAYCMKSLGYENKVVKVRGICKRIWVKQ